MASEKSSTSLFNARKEALRTQVWLESFHSVDYHIALRGSDEEKTLEHLAEEAFENILKNDKHIDLGEEFMDSKEKIERSKIFQVLSGMPKGALLHTHGIATGPFEKLVEILCKDPRVYVYTGKDVVGKVNGEIRYMTKSEIQKNSGEWIPASSYSEEELLAHITLPKETPRKDKWLVFENVWMRIRELSDSIPLWRGENSFFWHMLEKLLQTGVTYVEMKQLIPEAWVEPSEDGEKVDRTVSIFRFMDSFKLTVELFKKRNPSFVGAKMIWCTLKLLDEYTVQKNIQTVLELMKEYPDYIAGYDLVGHEDSLSPIAKYAKSLAEFKDKGGRLILHAGETLEPNAEQLYDAIAIGASRIGHGYALPKFPALMRIVREKGITIECCPISNQGLGYIHDLRNHPGHIMLNNGLRITISSDDAAIFGYSDLTFDFTLVAKAWGLKLSQLKHLARQSFKCTALTHEDQQIAEMNFDTAWEEFLKDFISSPTAKRASKRM